MSFLAQFPGNTNISVRTRSTFNDVSDTNFNFHFHISIEDGNCKKTHPSEHAGFLNDFRLLIKKRDGLLSNYAASLSQVSVCDTTMPAGSVYAIGIAEVATNGGRAWEEAYTLLCQP